MTSKVGKIAVLDGLRGLAVLMVFMVHAQNGVNSFFKEKASLSQLELAFQKVMGYFPLIGSIGGHFGVDLFFVLSGFLIYRTLTKKPVKFADFMVNRARRLLPAHFFTLLKSLAGFGLLTSLLNILMLSDLFIKIKTINFVTWTLTYELLFYILCAALVINSRRFKVLRSWTSLGLFSLLIVVSQYTFAEALTVRNINLPNIRFLTFFMGVAISKIYYEEKAIAKSISKYAKYFAIPSLLIIWAAKVEWGIRDYIPKSDFYRIQMEPLFVIIALAFSALVISMIFSEDVVIKKFFEYKPLRALGNISYSFYLVHALITLPIAKKILSEWQIGSGSKAFLFLPFGFAVSFLIASIMFHFLEKPYFVKKPILSNVPEKITEKEVW